MASAKRYKILVGSTVVFSGPWRTANAVFESLFQSFKLVGCDVPVTLAFDI